MSELSWHGDLAERLGRIEAQLGSPLPIQPIVSPLPVTETNPTISSPVFCAANSNHHVAAVTATSSVVLAANTNRRRLILHNDSGAAIFIMFGPVASLVAFSFRLTPNEVFQGPLGGYTGIVSAIKSSGTGNLQVTEVTT